MTPEQFIAKWENSTLKERPPLAADLDVSLINPDRAALGFAEGAQPALDQRRVGEHPAVQGGVIEPVAKFFRTRFATALRSAEPAQSLP
jgi:hypothetical protein